MSTNLNPAVTNDEPREPRTDAQQMGPLERKNLAIDALARTKSITELAKESSVSRPFVYKQAKKAEQALDRAFEPTSEDDTLLFNFPVTKKTIRIIVLVLILRCHSSYHGVIGFLLDVFGYKLSLGTVHNVVSAAIDKAEVINADEDLSRIRVGAHDEIFQGDPVLVGMDPHSSYCYLLAQENSRDATTWGVHLLDLSRKGLNLDYTVADAGKGLRAGQVQAWPDVPCWGDTFHPLLELGRMITYLDNRAIGAVNKTEQLERKMARAKAKGKGQAVSKKLALARQNEAVAIQLADDLRILGQWLRDDVLALAGPDLATRKELFDMIVCEMKIREHLAPHRICHVRTSLENQRDDLLAFVAHIDEQLDHIARQHHVNIEIAREVFEMLPLPPTEPECWQRDDALWKRLGYRYQSLKQEVQEMANQVVRASSMVENLNSRLRCYFFLRRQVGPRYLELLKFFLNHRRFPRSRKGRESKSPAEILNGAPLPHWLEQLGFERFSWAG